MGLGPLILGHRMHFTAAMGWYFARTFEGIEAHSGYEFSWSPYRWLPFATDHGYHAFHHSHSVGNYSTFFQTWDTIFGTNKAYNKYLNEYKEQGKIKQK